MIVKPYTTFQTPEIILSSLITIVCSLLNNSCKMKWMKTKHKKIVESKKIQENNNNHHTYIYLRPAHCTIHNIRIF